MFPNLSRRIAAFYKWLGLISIPVLTVVTAVSVANVFTRGQLAQSQTVQVWWAIIFAAAIEVNIVRLFFESKRDSDTAAKRLGVGLIIVAGVSLIIEGIQQSIGFDWKNVYMQIVIGLVVGLRVFVVMFLLAREGSRLATMLPETKQEDEQPIYACFVQFSEPHIKQQEDTPTEQPVQQESEQESEQQSVEKVNTPDTVVTFTHKAVSDKEKRILRALRANPDASLREIARKTKTSPGYVSQVRNRHMPTLPTDKVPAMNGHH